MKFQPKTAEEIATGMMLAPGDYHFEVANASDEISKKSGAEMIKVRLKVFDAHGGYRLVTDYLMEAMGFKFAHFCEGTGLMPIYQSGLLNGADCVGRCGKLKLGVEEQEGFLPKNVVKDYLSVEPADRQHVKTEVVKAPAAVDPNAAPF